MQEQEIWKDVVGWEGWYEVSNKGTVRSVDRTILYSDGRKRFFSGRILKPHIVNGYHHMDLSKNEYSIRLYAHRLVVEAFIGKIDFEMDVNHKNGIRSDNRVENLEICTRAENLLHCYRVLGRKANNYILNERKVEVVGYYIKERKSLKCRPEIDIEFGSFDSIVSAASFINKTPQAVLCAIQSEGTCGGYMWKKKEDIVLC